MGDPNLCDFCSVIYPKRSSDSSRTIRYSVKSISSSPFTLHKVFPGLEFNSDFICPDCFKLFRSKTLKSTARGVKRSYVRTPTKQLKRLNLSETPSPIKPSNFQPLTSSTPSHSADISSIHHQTACASSSTCTSSLSSSSSSFSKSSILKNFTDGHYQRAFIALAKESIAGKNALIKVASLLLQKEIKKCTRKRGQPDDRIKLLQGEITLERMETFSWAGVRDEMEDKMPATSSILKMLMVSPTHIKDGVRKGKLGAIRYICTCNLV